MSSKIMLFAASAAAFVLIYRALLIVRTRQSKLFIGYLRQRRLERQAGRYLCSMRAMDLQLTRVAFHEAGHALVSWLSPHAMNGIQVIVVSRNRGYVRHRWADNKHRMQSVLWDALTVSLAGAVAESMRFRRTDCEKYPSGCSDLRKAIATAKDILFLAAMNGPEHLDNCDTLPSNPITDKEFFSYLDRCGGAELDSEVRCLLQLGYYRAHTILTANSLKLDKLAAMALHRRQLTGLKIRRLLGERPRFNKRTT